MNDLSINNLDIATDHFIGPSAAAPDFVSPS